VCSATVRFLHSCAGWALRSSVKLVVRQTCLLVHVSPRIHASPQTLWACPLRVGQTLLNVLSITIIRIEPANPDFFRPKNKAKSATNHEMHPFWPPPNSSKCRSRAQIGLSTALEPETRSRLNPEKLGGKCFLGNLCVLWLMKWRAEATGLISGVFGSLPRPPRLYFSPSRLAVASSTMTLKAHKDSTGPVTESARLLQVK